MYILHGMIRIIDGISELTGRLLAYLVISMVLLIAYDVAMRYLLHAGSVALQELEWHLFAVMILLGAGYTLKHDEHVRVDLLYHSAWLNDTHRAIIDLLGALFLLLPFCALIIWSSWDFVARAYLSGEVSPDPGGLPWRWVLKAMIPLGFSLLALQGVGEVLRRVNYLIASPKR